LSVPAAGENAAPLVTGEIVIASGVPALHGAAVHVWLEDVSHADGEALTVTETILQDVHHDPGAHRRGGTPLPFALHAPSDAIDPRKDYAVRVWLDRNGDGREGLGDLYSDQSYRVLTRGFGGSLTVMLGPSPGIAREGDSHGGE